MDQVDDEGVDRGSVGGLSDAEVLSLLTDALEPRPPDIEARARLLTTLHAGERFSPFLSEVASAFGLATESVREAFACIRDPSAWHPAFFPGSEILSTSALRAAHAVIARVPAGTRIAMHAHPRRELTYVLDGELVENRVRRVGPGELLDPELGSAHEIAVGGDGACLVVFALPDAPGS